MTEYAIGLIGCVAACRQRYGVNVVLDTLRGAKTAKIRQYRMDEVPQYGQFAKVPAYGMRPGIKLSADARLLKCNR